MPLLPLQPVWVNPATYHATQDWETGHRLVLVAYHLRALKGALRTSLQQLGFPLPDLPSIEPANPVSCQGGGRIVNQASQVRFQVSPVHQLHLRDHSRTFRKPIRHSGLRQPVYRSLLQVQVAQRLAPALVEPAVQLLEARPRTAVRGAQVLMIAPPTSPSIQVQYLHKHQCSLLRRNLSAK